MQSSSDMENFYRYSCSKKSKPASLNDFRPVALTSLAMKCLEKIVQTEVLKETEHLLDPLQFAYMHRKGVEGATLTILNLVHTHLEKETVHTRIMFVDFHHRSILSNPTCYWKGSYVILS